MLPSTFLTEMWYLLVTMTLCLSKTLTLNIVKPFPRHTSMTQAHFKRSFFADTSRFGQHGAHDMADFTSKHHRPKDPYQAWSCGCNYYWRDLGDEFYPRFVKDGRCKTTSCWYGHYVCVPFTYQLFVLKRLTPTELADNGYRYSFGDEYAFVSVNVTANCQCRHDIVKDELDYDLDYAL